ncbi:MAG: hypothetical protein LBC02_08550 [Planctomycetaceae bacterium]|nr:hypothetical protein [Planctomycetaceae bacterium]
MVGNLSAKGRLPSGKLKVESMVVDVSPKHRSALADSNPVFGRKWMLPTGWSLISNRTPGHCRLAPTDLSAKCRLTS